MRKIGIIIVLLVSFVTVWGQTVTDADCYEQDQKAVITYSLDQKANIDLQMSLNGAPFQTLDRTSLSGDVGANVRKGKNKKIVWDVLNDCNSLVGDVQFKVVPSESLDDYNKRIQKENYYRTGYPALCRSYYKSVGTWSVSFADMGIAGGVRDREGKAPLYFGIGTFRYKFFEVSLVAFKLELTSAASAYSMNTTYDAPDFYWEPQVRFVLPVTDSWAVVLAGGPSLNMMADYNRWSFATTARVRYSLTFVQMDFFAGYEHKAFVAGISMSLKWAK